MNQDWEEFQTLAQHASVFNTVVDFIPLEEILAVHHEIVERTDTTMKRSGSSNSLATMLESQQKRAAPLVSSESHGVSLYSTHVRIKY